MPGRGAPTPPAAYKPPPGAPGWGPPRPILPWGTPGWAPPAQPAVYKPPVGARVASPQSPILRWSTPRVSALDWATSGLSKSPLLIARPLLLTTNCPLLLTTAVRFCSHRDSSLCARPFDGERLYQGQADSYRSGRNHGHARPHPAFTRAEGPPRRRARHAGGSRLH